MSSPDHDTMSQTSRQVERLSADEWNSQIVPQLPVGWQEQADILRAHQRTREIRSASDLLRGLLAYTLCVTSFRHLGAWGVLVGLADISDTAWRKHLRQAGEWLVWLLRELLKVAACQSPWLVRAGFRRVLLLDATHLACPGPRGKVWRVHTAFDLLAGRISELQITDRKVSETLTLFDVQAGDLLVSDSANGYRDRLAYVRERQADLVVRFSVQSLPLCDGEGHALNVVRWLKGHHARAGRVCEREVLIEYKGKPYPLRCIAKRFTAEQTRRAQRHKKRRAREEKRQITQDTLYTAGWLLLVTTLPAEQWSAQQILQLYQARWHIELLFKRIKQLLDHHRLRCHTALSARASMASLLLSWALQEEEAVQARLCLQEAMREVQDLPQPQRGQVLLSLVEPAPISQWRVAMLCLDQLRGCVHGSISRERLRACWPRLQRFVRGSPRRRRHLYTDWCRWLTGASASPVEALP
jgi:Transposase DDE domain